MRLSDYAALGGHMDHVRPLAMLKAGEFRQVTALPKSGSRP